MRRPADSIDTSAQSDWASLAKTVLAATHSSPALDIGCGLGEYLMQYRAWFPDRLLLGIDLSRQRVKEAAARSKASSTRVLFAVAAAECLPFRSESFSAVTCRVVLSYVWLRPVLCEMRRVMYPGSIAAIQVHSAFHYWALSIKGMRDHSLRLVGYAAWVAVNTALLYLLGNQTKFTLLGRSGAPHTFLTTGLFRRLLKSAGFTDLEPWLGAPRGEPAFLVRTSN